MNTVPPGPARQLSPAVLAALRAGRRLCPTCLGQGRVELVALPDWEGDEPLRWLRCPDCQGSGLEPLR